MAYVNLKTNEIWTDSNIDGFLNDCVEIDEVIAPLILELNVRGYKTLFCCSGHPFDACNEVFTATEEGAEGIVNVVSVEKVEDGLFPYRVVTTLRDDDFYIFFAENQQEQISLPLPDGFYWYDTRTIRYNYVSSEFYEFLEERRLATCALHEWALQLPQLTQ